MLSEGASPGVRGRAWSPLVALWATVVCAFLAGMWALASPVFSVPDENAHVTKAIALMQGDFTGHAVTGVQHRIVSLPPGDAYSPQQLCFAGHPERSANCGVAFGSPGGTGFFANWVATYNPTYYVVVGWPSLFLTGNAAVYAMRFVSVLASALLLGWAFGVVARSRWRWLPVGFAFTAAPMVLYLAGSVNPNGLEIAAGVALWVGLLRLLETFRGCGRSGVSPAAGSGVVRVPRLALWIGVGVSVLLLANVRALGPLWVLVVVVGCVIVVGWRPALALLRTRSSWPWLALGVVGAVGSALWTSATGTLGGQSPVGDAPLVRASFVTGFVYTLRHTPTMLQQALGWFGWLDTPLQTWAYWPIAGALGAVIVLALVALRGWDRWIALGVIVAAVLLPPVVQAISIHQTGYIWQGRYGLFFYLGAMLVLGLLLDRGAPEQRRLAGGFGWIVAACVAGFGVFAFARVLVRYAVGGQPVSTLLHHPEWQPPGVRSR